MKHRDYAFFASGTLLSCLMLVGWFLGLKVAPVDAFQGEVYRIIYLHVPSAFAAFTAAAILAVASFRALRGKPSQWARASVEVGLIFTVLTLATGSIWGRPTWGTWWTWDARLTTTFLLFLLFAAYLLLFHSLDAEKSRDKACAVLGILIFADVPIIYKSVQWWRTLHQTQTILRPGGSAMSGEMLWILMVNLVAMLGVCVWMMALRAANLQLKSELELKLMETL